MAKIGKSRNLSRLMSSFLALCMVWTFFPKSALASDPIAAPTDLSLSQENEKTYAQWNSKRSSITSSSNGEIKYSLEIYRAGQTESPVYSSSDSPYEGQEDMVKVDLTTPYFDSNVQNGGYYFRVKNLETVDGNKVENSSEWSSYSNTLWIGECNSEIKSIDISGAVLSYKPGETPVAKASVLDSSYKIVYERWEEMEEKEDKSLTPVAYWYSNDQHPSSAKKITSFEEGKLYQYSISLETQQGFKFSNDVKVTINGNKKEFSTGLLVVGNEGKTCFMDAINSFRPVTMKIIDTIEVNNVKFDFKAGDKPIFTGKVPEGVPYYIDHEGWTGEDSGWTSSDFWNQRYHENPEIETWGKPLTSFEEGKKYDYRIYLKVNSSSGYRFDKEKTKLKINGEIINFDNPNDVEIDSDIGEAAWFSHVHSITISKSGESQDEPKIIEGMNSEWIKGSGKGLEFRSDADYLSFIGVEVDGEEVGEDNYSKREGSIIIELKSEYLETLSPGNHTITIKSTEGNASTDFTISSSASLPSLSPSESSEIIKFQKTGDNNDIMVYISIILISLGLIAITSAFNRKKLNATK